MQKIDGTTILVNRGDTLNLSVSIKTADETPYTFQQGDKVIFAVYPKKEMDKRPVLKKEVNVEEESQTVVISCTGEETKIGDYINKPVDYWYEIELNNEYTVLGYDDEGPKILRLYPEGYRYE